MRLTPHGVEDRLADLFKSHPVEYQEPYEQLREGVACLPKQVIDDTSDLVREGSGDVRALEAPSVASQR